MYIRKYPIAPVTTMVCQCGKNAEDGYTVEVWDGFKCHRPKGVRLCCECYEYACRQDWSKYKCGMTSSSVKGYHV